MPKKIQILPENVARAIAAGEVVERPASVVKELMENAIDAGASEIAVELKAGGLQLIRVSDNGEGIDPEDIPVALQRYATSKIKRSEDLFAIHTLGFRGEALPSIAAVSQMTIKTRVVHSLSGSRLVCEGGEIKSITEVGCPVGTEVEVRNLFYNIPVKRKFAKSIQTELRHSLNHFLRLSLSHPALSFKFIHEGRVLYEHLKTDSPMVRIETLLGGEVSRHLHPIEFVDGENHLKGVASLPSFSRGNGEGIYLYVNQRFIKDRMIYKAILEAYRHVIPAGRFPVVVLFMTLPPSAIDVNVHPTKAEVKFRDSERIFHIVQGTVASALASPHALTEREDASGQQGRQPSLGEPPDRGMTRLHPLPFPLIERDKEVPPVVREGRAPEWEAENTPLLRLLGQIQATYILCEGEEGLILIDQHAAHERLLFEQYKRAYEMGSLPSERLLIPIPMELSTEESFVLMSHLEDFQLMGFEIDSIGERMVAIRTLPKLTESFDPQRMVRELLEELSFVKREGKRTETVQKMLVTLACHSAIRGNFILRREEMGKLVDALYPFNHSLTCPHGRPVFFVIPPEELARQFKRKG